MILSRIFLKKINFLYIFFLIFFWKNVGAYSTPIYTNYTVSPIYADTVYSNILPTINYANNWNYIKISINTNYWEFTEFSIKTSSNNRLVLQCSSASTDNLDMFIIVNQDSSWFLELIDYRCSDWFYSYNVDVNDSLVDVNSLLGLYTLKNNSVVTINSILDPWYTPACTSWTYSDWWECQTGGYQYRTVLTSSPAWCSGGIPAISQICTYNDGYFDSFLDFFTDFFNLSSDFFEKIFDNEFSWIGFWTIDFNFYDFFEINYEKINQIKKINLTNCTDIFHDTLVAKVMLDGNPEYTAYRMYGGIYYPPMEGNATYSSNGTLGRYYSTRWIEEFCYVDIVYICVQPRYAYYYRRDFAYMTPVDTTPVITVNWFFNSWNFFPFTIKILSINITEKISDFINFIENFSLNAIITPINTLATIYTDISVMYSVPAYGSKICFLWDEISSISYANETSTIRKYYERNNKSYNWAFIVTYTSILMVLGIWALSNWIRFLKKF